MCGLYMIKLKKFVNEFKKQYGKEALEIKKISYSESKEAKLRKKLFTGY